MKESKKINIYLDRARERKKLWNVKVTVITIIIGIMGTVLRDLEKTPREQEIRFHILPDRKKY